MQGTVLSVGDTAVNKTKKYPDFVKFTFSNRGWGVP